MALKLNSAGGGSVTMDVPSTASAFSLTVPAATGNIITSGDTGTVTGTMIAASTIAPAKLSQPFTRMASQATTSGTAIDFTGIPSWATRVTVVLNGVSVSATATILIQLGSTNPPVSTGYLTATSGASSSSLGGSQPTTGFGFDAGSSLVTAARVDHGVATFYNISGNIWVGYGVVGHSEGIFTSWFGGSVTLAGVLDRVRLTNDASNTFDAGTVNVFYE
jgi:hypothetical protein